MPSVPPDLEQLESRFPQFKKLELLASGGFKVVYRAEKHAGTEALKLIEISGSSEVEDLEAFRTEMFARTKREIEALEKCAIPELVMLGSVPPERASIGGREFVVYSEEFLDGPNLSSVIRTAHAISQFPTENQVKELFRSGLRVIQELWRNGYIHRDIKPLNIVKLDNVSRRFVYLDLGIAFSVLESSI